MNLILVKKYLSNIILMGGALLQLSMRGEQDKFLNMKREISYFKTVYKQHGGFATQTQELFFNSSEFGNRSVAYL